MRRLIPLAIFVLAIISLLFSYQKPVESAERCAAYSGPLRATSDIATPFLAITIRATPANP